MLGREKINGPLLSKLLEEIDLAPKYGKFFDKKLIKLYFLKGLQYIYDIDPVYMGNFIKKKGLNKAPLEFERNCIKDFIKLIRMIEEGKKLTTKTLQEVGLSKKEFEFLVQDPVIKQFIREKIEERNKKLKVATTD